MRKLFLLFLVFSYLHVIASTEDLELELFCLPLDSAICNSDFIMHVPGLGLYRLDGARYTAMDDNQKVCEFVQLPDSMAGDKCIFTIKGLLVKHKNTILRRFLNDKVFKKIFRLPTEDFDIINKDEEITFVKIPTDTSTMVCAIDPDTMEYSLLLTLDYNDAVVIPGQDCDYLSSAGSLIRVGENEYQPIIDLGEPIICGVATDYGVVLSTPSQTGLLIDDDHYMPLFDEGVTRLWYSDDILYLLSYDGWLFKLDLSPL